MPLLVHFSCDIWDSSSESAEQLSERARHLQTHSCRSNIIREMNERRQEEISSFTVMT